MKNKIALASAFVAASSLATAEVVINDFLSFEGFVDMSYSHTNIDSNSGAIDSTTDNSYGIDQVEIDWLFDFDPVTAQIDLAHEGSDNSTISGDNVVEQAYVTYQLDNGGAITAGRFASMLGFEAFEPTGLYQYSFAYRADEDETTGLSSNDGILPLYDQGVKYTYETETTFFGVSVVDSVNDDTLGGSTGADSGYGVEIAGAMDAGNGLNFFLGGRYNDVDSSTLDNSFVLDSYATFETGAWIFAGEVVYGETQMVSADDKKTFQALVMANFAYSDAASVTGRISYVEQSNTTDESFFKYTLAHGYAFTDNLALVTEVSLVDAEDADEDVDVLTGAVELIFSF